MFYNWSGFSFTGEVRTTEQYITIQMTSDSSIRYLGFRGNVYKIKT